MILKVELETHFDKWLYILKNLEDLSSRPTKLQEKIFAKLFKQAEIANYSDEEYARYENSLKAYRDLRNTMDTAFGSGKQEGKVEGIIEGRIEGKIEGKIEGRIEGRIEEKLEIAQKMKQSGMDLKTISELTGLSINDIEN